ncbi:DEAD/DEAH box helicase, partial [Arthrospira platensis SPKY1]|nr:DEAD/DEAH box helicase [Arthrospira platensis SPKY1]
MSFQDFPLDARIQQGLSDAGYAEATPLQREVLPPALDGATLLVRAKSGMGKDACLILPILKKLLSSAPQNEAKPRALVLTASP